jgi:hypothetical protein
VLACLSALHLAAAPATAQGGAVAPAVALVPDLSRLIARRDSLVAYDAAGPAGYLVIAWGRTADGGVRYAETVAVPDVLDYVAVVRLDADGRMRRALVNGQAGDVDLALDLAWDAAGGVRGVASRPTPRGARLVAVDTALAPDVLDVNAVLAVLPAIPWAADTRGTLAVLRAPDGVVPLVVRVAGRERLPLEGASVDAWRIEVVDAGRRTTYHVAASGPPAVLRIATDGAPLRFERAAPPD